MTDGAGAATGVGDTATGGARILDRGYQHYRGERRGPRHAVASVTLESTKRVLGVRRSVWAKLVSIVTAALAFVPAIVFVGMAALIPDDLRDALLDDGGAGQYAGYYFTISAALILFSAFAGPEILCPDRRTGLLGLYLASPLTRDTYLLAKAAAAGTVLGIVTLGPPLLLLAGNTMLGLGPDGIGGWILLFGRILAAGVAISLLYTALTLAVSSVTTRHAVAAAAIIIILLISAVTTASLVEGAGMDHHVALLNLIGMPFEVVVRIYGESNTGDDRALEEVSTGAVLGAYAAWTVALGLFVRFRYQRLDVTR